jgi:hypothetical protein
MHSGKTKADKEQPVRQPAAKAVNAAKGYAAVTQFMQPPAAKHTAGNALPKQLKSGIEGLSGLPMDDVQVHYNSSEPARIGALASAKGNKIDLGPGQEKHLPHEAWHVVQQKQGRVKPTLQAKGLAINDDQALETEADIMGQKALELKTGSASPLPRPGQSASAAATNVVQRKIGFEFQSKHSISVVDAGDERIYLGTHMADPSFTIEGDVGASISEGILDLEIQTPAFEETNADRTRLADMMKIIVQFADKIVDQQLPKVHKDVKWDGLDELKEEEGEEVKFRVAGAKRFAPQASIGVKFEKIADLIEALTKAPTKPGKKPASGSAGVAGAGAAPAAAVPSKKMEVPKAEAKEAPKAEVKGIRGPAGISRGKLINPQQSFRRTSEQGLREAKKLFPAPEDAALVGLAAIFLGLYYHAQLAPELQPEQKGHVKYWMSFMLRNGFLPYYNAMTEPQKVRFVTTLF